LANYKVIALLDKTNAFKKVDLGLVYSSAASGIVGLVMDCLRQDGHLETGISQIFLFVTGRQRSKWLTKSVGDAFYAAPQWPRLTSPDAIKDRIVRGVSNGLLAHVGKTDTGSYRPLTFNQAMMTADVEISDDMFSITKKTAEAFLKTEATRSEWRRTSSRERRRTRESTRSRTYSSQGRLRSRRGRGTHVFSHEMER